MPTVDYTQAQNRYNLAREMLAQNLQPRRGAGPIDSIGSGLIAMLNAKTMGMANNQMKSADQAEKDTRAIDLANALGAGRGDTAYNQTEAETFPGEAPIPGLTNKGTGQFNPMAMAQSMMGAKTSGLPEAGLKMLAGSMGGNAGPGMGKYNPGDFTPKSWATFMQTRDPRGLKRYEPYKVVNIAGVPTLVATNSEAVDTPVTPLSNLKKETEAAAASSGATEEAKLKKQYEWKGKIASSVKTAEAEAVEKGEAFTDYNRAAAAMPGLLESVAELKELAQIATSTIGGKIWDQAVQQTGFGATEGGTARAKFIAIINNQVLPLLKPTFGGSFSIQEGESLKATMGDPDATPEAKIAQLSAFIEQKYRTIEAKQRQVSGSAPQGSGVDMSDDEYEKRKQALGL